MPEFAPGSYRDRDARVFVDEHGEIWRGLSPEASSQWSRFSKSQVFLYLTRSGQLVPTESAEPTSRDPMWSDYLHHERIPCISYPFEWPFSLLKAAALLHLDLLEQLEAEDFSLKDGTAYNVQFRGVDPVFIDVTSIETLNAGRPWSGYRQFCQTMLFPLMMQAYKNVAFQPWLRGRLDGITATETSRLMSFRDLFRRGVWSHVKLHAWIENSQSANGEEQAATSAPLGFNREMWRANIRKLKSLVSGLEWRAASSNWFRYEASHSYSAEDRQQKEDFVRQHLSTNGGRVVWDLGANTGTFSRIAAESAESVLSIDFDHLSVESLCRQLQSESSPARRKILPLVWNVADQTLGLGWKGTERVGLSQRSRPDVVLCLALIHHLVITCGIPMSEFIEWLASLGAKCIVEFVDPADSMAAQLLRQRRGPCPDYRWDHFESELRKRFDIQDIRTLQGGLRTLVMAAPRV